MVIIFQKLIKFWSRDNLICEKVLGKWTPTPPGIEFWRTEIKFYDAGHRKTATTTKVPICRSVILREKITILDALFDNIEPELLQGEQQ